MDTYSDTCTFTSDILIEQHHLTALLIFFFYKLIFISLRYICQSKANNTTHNTTYFQINASRHITQKLKASDSSIRYLHLSLNTSSFDFAHALLFSIMNIFNIAKRNKLILTSSSRNLWPTINCFATKIIIFTTSEPFNLPNIISPHVNLTCCHAGIFAFRRLSRFTQKSAMSAHSKKQCSISPQLLQNGSSITFLVHKYFLVGKNR